MWQVLVKRKRKRACQRSRTCTRWLALGPYLARAPNFLFQVTAVQKSLFFPSEHPNRQAIRMAPDHPAANQRGWLPRRVVINPLNSRLEYLCCHQAIYRPDSRFRNQSGTSVQSKGWLHFNFYRSEPCSVGQCSNKQGGYGTFDKKRV